MVFGMMLRIRGRYAVIDSKIGINSGERIGIHIVIVRAHIRVMLGSGETINFGNSNLFQIL